METDEILDGMLASHKNQILLVSEDNLVRFTLQNFFKDSNLVITATQKREEGLKLLRKERFDAVITEIGSDSEASIQFRKDIRLHDGKIPILFMTPLFYWSGGRLLDQIVEDPHSFYIPENADRQFMEAKLMQVIGSCQAENALAHMKHKMMRNWFLANLLQQAMLPPWVYFSEHYEFSCFYRPYTKISGDLFEWLPLDDNRALFIFGDISGHGTHSALAMTAVQSFLTQIILHDKERAAHPSLIAADINNFFYNRLHNIVYMSTLIAYIDFGKNHLRYQNAGYMDLLCVDAETGELKNINPENKGSLPLGMMKDAVYSDKDDVEYDFPDSAAFLFFSDGLTDLSKDKEGNNYMDMEMFKQLVSVLISDARKEGKSMALPFRCHHSLEQFGYRFPQDDISMVLVRKAQVKEKQYTFACRVPTDKNAVDMICEKASEFVTEHYRNDELSVNTELLLEEFLVNVIQHGLNEYEKLNEFIAIKLCAYDNELKLIIWDRGREWNGFMMQQSKAEEKLEELNEQMETHGRGLPIISAIASKISRQRYCGLNESIFVIPLRKNKTETTKI